MRARGKYTDVKPLELLKNYKKTCKGRVGKKTGTDGRRDRKS